MNKTKKKCVRAHAYTTHTRHAHTLKTGQSTRTHRQDTLDTHSTHTHRCCTHGHKTNPHKNSPQHSPASVSVSSSQDTAETFFFSRLNDTHSLHPNAIKGEVAIKANRRSNNARGAERRTKLRGDCSVVWFCRRSGMRHQKRGRVSTTPQAVLLGVAACDRRKQKKKVDEGKKKTNVRKEKSNNSTAAE